MSIYEHRRLEYGEKFDKLVRSMNSQLEKVPKMRRTEG